MSVLIVLEQRDGKLHRMSREAIAAGQALAAHLGEPAEAMILGQDISALAGEVAGCDLAKVRVADHSALANYTPGGFVSAVAGVMGELSPSHVVLPHTYQTVDFMARLAQATNSAYLPEVTDFSGEASDLRWQRPILGGKLLSEVRIKGEGCVLVSIQSGVYSGDRAVSGQAEVVQASLSGDLVADREILGVEQAGGDHVDLGSANVIVAIGRGIGGADKLEPVQALASVLGAELGASRPVIDSGWLDRDRQIGSSGQTVSPKLYLAFGISGAIQHLVGMKASSCIVAVNKDAGAPIFNVAHYGIVGDLHELIPAITEAIQEAES